MSRNFLHDRFILLLVTLNVFLAALCASLILLRIGLDQGGAYIVQYRSNVGIGAYKPGGLSNLIAFALFGILTAFISIIISIRAYALKRGLAVVVLSLGLFMLLLAIIVSNALLILR